MLIVMLENVEINTCPNSSDSRDDCKDCSFACGWHQVDMKCVPREGIDVTENSYGRLPIDERLLFERKKRIKNAHKIYKTNGHRKERKIAEEAIWV